MLAIKKQSRAFKAIAAGSLAFAFGLTGVAAYVNSSLEHQNLVFGKEQTVSKSDNKSSGEVVLGTQQEGNVQTTTPTADDMQWFAPAATSKPATNAPQSASASVATSTATGAEVTVAPADPVVTPPVVVEDPATPAPGGVDLNLGLCADLLPGILPVIGVNCRAN